MTERTYVPGRACGSCSLCCKLLAIAELDKPRQTWCPHADVGKGCRVYNDRPLECRTYNCAYLMNAEVGEHWRPTTSRMVLTFDDEAKLIVIHVDAGRPDAWRKEPYYAEIKRWAVNAAEGGGQVIVWQRGTAIAVLPDREKDIGQIDKDRVIVISKDMGPDGPVYDANVFAKDDPRLRAMRGGAA